MINRNNDHQSNWIEILPTGTTRWKVVQGWPIKINLYGLPSHHVSRRMHEFSLYIYGFFSWNVRVYKEPAPLSWDSNK